MSLRQPHVAPATPPASPSRSQRSNPMSPASPTSSAFHDRHITQLNTYRPKPDKSKAQEHSPARIALGSSSRNRAHNGLPRPANEKRNQSWLRRLGLGAGNADAGLLDIDGDGEGSKKYRRRGLRNDPRLRRGIVYFVLVLGVYLLVIRPLVRPNSTNPPVSPSSDQAASGSRQGKGKDHQDTELPPLHSRRNPSSSSTSSDEPRSRAPLPAVVLGHKAPDHPVKNGLLVVDPQSRVHPIYQLIRDAREQWDAKLARQSKTLKQAVEEYKKRYRRAPPRGFDKWWNYVCEHNVQLPDEYDQISRDLEPFFGLSPRDLRKRVEETAKLPDTYSLKVRRGSVRTSSLSTAYYGADERMNQQVEMLQQVARWLPDLQVVWSVHDTARSLVTWDHKAELKERIEEGEYWDEDEQIDSTLRTYGAACPPGSPLRVAQEGGRGSIPSPSMAQSSIKTFISSPAAVYNLCNHPSIVPLHGMVAKLPDISPLLPLFSLSKTALHSDILGVPTESWVNADELDCPPFEEKTQSRLLWRGSNTGTWYSNTGLQASDWKQTQRMRLAAMNNMQELDGDLTILPPPKRLSGRRTVGDETRESSWEAAVTLYLDVSFTGDAIQCNEEDFTCKEIRETYDWKRMMTFEDAFNFKYILDIDGNAWSARFNRLLAQGSLVLKSTIMPEWWTDRMQAWVHYVPIQIDYSDLFDTMTFFRGDLMSKNGEPALAADIAWAGQQWTKEHWRRKDMVAYTFRLYLEWGRLVGDRKGGFIYDESMERTWGEPQVEVEAEAEAEATEPGAQGLQEEDEEGQEEDEEGQEEAEESYERGGEGEEVD